MPSALCAQLTRDLFAIAKFLYKVQIEDHSVDDRVRMIRYGRIWFPLVLVRYNGGLDPLVVSNFNFYF